MGIVLRLLQSAHPNLDVIIAVAQQFKGHFGIVYQDKRKIVAVTDCIASYLIFYRSFDHVCNIATSANALGPDRTIDKSQAKAIMLSATVLVVALYSGKYHRLLREVFFQNGDQKITFYQLLQV